MANCTSSRAVLRRYKHVSVLRRPSAPQTLVVVRITLYAHSTREGQKHPPTEAWGTMHGAHVAFPWHRHRAKENPRTHGIPSFLLARSSPRPAYGGDYGLQHIQLTGEVPAPFRLRAQRRPPSSQHDRLSSQRLRAAA